MLSGSRVYRPIRSPGPVPRPGTGREGAGLLGMVLVLLAMAVVAAMAVVPNAAQVNDQWRVLRTLDRLAALTDSPTAIVRFEDDLGTYPGALSHLSTAIAANDLSLCGSGYGGPASGNWGGRYAGRLYLATGTPLPMGTMRDTLEYDATAGAQALVVVITDVREEQARQLDLKADGAFDATLGRVRYTVADPQGLVTVRWRTPIATC